MKYTLGCLLVCIAFTCCKSQKPFNKMPADHRKALIEIINNTPMKLDFDAEKLTKVFADSLNNLTTENSLPSFLYNECFDVKKMYWPNLHQPISLRQMVVSKVTNKAVIEKILKDESPFLRDTCDYQEFAVPEIGKSFYELFRLRYAELNK